ncbi:hypothetical protein KEM52_000492 [Ascosphaera acerosa]|nr:hypothetical protein KEM52_000492 [Ascosphaera acerosa]
MDPSRSRRDRDRESRKKVDQNTFVRQQVKASNDYTTGSNGGSGDGRRSNAVRSSATSGSTREGRPLSAPGEEYMSSSSTGQRRNHHRSNSQHANLGQTQTLGRSRGAKITSGAESPDSRSESKFAAELNGTHLHKRSPVQQAFERWETLSSHWEGLTGFWIRQLEMNTDQLARTPTGDIDANSTVMSRQISDLSAAGANLFHAVVELQRLRSSSEKKFQKWYYETRTQHDELKSVISQLEAQVQRETQDRLTAIEKAKAAELDKVKAEGLLAEVKRELQISREEARRAWEELGRREQEERERVMNLRNCQPTIVGGVQVVPMQAAFYGQMDRGARAAQPGQSGNPPYPNSEHGYDSPVVTDPYAGATPKMDGVRSGPFDDGTGLGIRTDVDPGARSVGTIRGVPTSMSDIDVGSEYDVMTPGVGAVEAGGVTPKRQRYTESLVSEEDYGTEIEPLHEKYRQNRNYGLTPSQIELASPGADSIVDMPMPFSNQQAQYGNTNVVPMPISGPEPQHHPGDASTGMAGTSHHNPVDYSNARYETAGVASNQPMPSHYSHQQDDLYPDEHDESFDSTGTVTQEESPIDPSGPNQPSSLPDRTTGSAQEPKWEAVAGRHRHPTRLSAVYEEDERSRTTSGAHSRSISLASRAD